VIAVRDVLHVSPGLGGIPVSHAFPKFSRLALATAPSGVFWARLHVVNVLRSWLLPETIIETARLLVSELAGTEVRRAAVDAGAGSSYAIFESARVFAVILDLREDRLTVTVQGSGLDTPSSSVAADIEDTGRRDVLIAALSRRWGSYGTEPGRGTVVWAELAVPETQADSPSLRGNSPSATSPSGDTETATSLLIGRVLVALREL